MKDAVVLGFCIESQLRINTFCSKCGQCILGIESEIVVIADFELKGPALESLCILCFEVDDGGSCIIGDL